MHLLIILSYKTLKLKSTTNEWNVHFASCFYIKIYCIMGCYFTLCHNTYGYSLLFYKVYMKRENAGNWNSGLEKEQILETYSAQLQKSWNSTEVIFGNNKKYWVKKIPKGAHTLATRGPTRQGARPGGRAGPHPRGRWVAPLWYFLRSIFFYIFWKRLPWSFRTFGAVQNRSLIFAPFPAQNSSCRHSPSSCKPCKIWENRHKYCDIMCNNSPQCNKYQYKSMMQNGSINSPKLRPRLSSSGSR